MMPFSYFPAHLTGIRDGTQGTGIAATPLEAASTKKYINKKIKNEEITELAMDRASVQRARIGGGNKCYNVPRCGGECQIRPSWKPLTPGTAGEQN